MVVFWLFAPKFWKVVGNHSLSAGSVVGIPWGGGDTQTIPYAKEFELFALRPWGWKNFTCEHKHHHLHLSHRVKLSLFSVLVKHPGSDTHPGLLVLGAPPLSYSPRLVSTRSTPLSYSPRSVSTGAPRSDIHPGLLVLRGTPLLILTQAC